MRIGLTGVSNVHDVDDFLAKKTMQDIALSVWSNWYLAEAKLPFEISKINWPHSACVGNLTNKN